jgi:alpha-L-fucosidase
MPSALQLDWFEHDIGCMITWNAFTNCVNATDSDASELVCRTCDQGTGNHYRVVTPEAMLTRDFPHSFNVTAQVEAAASFGASYIIFVVNQMVGFALWPTKANNFSIANSKFRGGGYDIVAEYVAACRTFNIKPGIFYTTKENNYNGVGKGKSIGPKNYSVTEQDAFIVQQLTELMLSEKYGDIYELWLDGGLGAEYNQTAAFLLRHGHKWLTHGFPARNGIRWVGNEHGVAGQPNWAAATLVNDLDVRGRGNPYGNIFYPSSADCVLREVWTLPQQSFFLRLRVCVGY